VKIVHNAQKRLPITSCTRNEFTIFLVIEYYVLKRCLSGNGVIGAFRAKRGKKISETASKGKSQLPALFVQLCHVDYFEMRMPFVASGCCAEGLLLWHEKMAPSLI
jgi:hypothetical protein